MSSINTNGTVQDQLFAASEAIFLRGMVPDMTEPRGKWANRIKKDPGDTIMPDLTGMGGDPQQPFIQVPFQDGFGAGAGSSFLASYLGAEPVRGGRFKVPLGTLFAHMPTTLTRQQLQTKGGLMDPRLRDGLTSTPAQVHWFVLSQLLWSDGNGIFGKVDALNTPPPIAGNTIRMVNHASTNWIHKGQEVTLADPAQVFIPGRLVSHRAQAVPGTTPPLKVKSIDPESGTVTIEQSSITVVIPTAALGDLVIPWSFFPAIQSDGNVEPDYFEPPVGFFAWVPRTTKEAKEDMFGVVRSDDLRARSGKRIMINKNDSVTSVVAQIAEALENLPTDGMADNVAGGTLWYPASRVEGVMEAFQRNNVHVEPNSAQLNDKRTFQIGTRRQIATFPSGHTLGIESDRMLVDHYVAKAEDNTWVVQLDRKWKITATEDSFQLLRDPSGDVLRRIDGSTQAMATTHAMWGQLVPDGVGNNIVASPYATDLTRKTF